MRVAALVVAAALPVSLAGCSSEESLPQPSIAPTTSAENEAVARNAVQAVVETCRLQRFAGDIASIRAEAIPKTYSPRWEQQYGWHSRVDVHVGVVSSPSTIPRSFRAAGHTLHFKAGGGDRPGLVASKEPSQRVCGPMPASSSGGDRFLANDRFALVDQLNQ